MVCNLVSDLQNGVRQPLDTIPAYEIDVVKR